MDRRKTELKQYNQLYKKLEFVDPRSRWRCFYCNEPMDGMDHQPPISQIGYMLISGEPFEAVIVPACTECNATLSDAQTMTLSERMSELKERLRKKYRSQMRVAGQWTYEELQELGYSLREMILASAKMGDAAEYRVLYPGHHIRDTAKVVDPLEVRTCPFCDTVHEDDTCPNCGRNRAKSA